jgi:hypothetical protein
MNWGIFTTFAILLLFFIPIPIKITVTYKNNHLCLFVYKFNIKLSKKEKKKLNKDAKKSYRSFNITFSDIMDLIHEIDCLRFKPTLRMKIILDYGLVDASSTGIAFGVLNSFSPFIFRLLSIMFKVKKYDLKINPNFNQLMLKGSIKSIIFISLAKIIYIMIKAIKQLKFIKQKNNYACSNA